MDENHLVQLSAAFFEPFAHVKGTTVGTPRVDMKGRRTMWGIGCQAPRKDCKGTEKGRFAGSGSLVIGRPIQNDRKSEDHG